MPKKILFILGHGRSGTTLLNLALLAHSDIAFINGEFNDLFWFFKNQPRYDCYGQQKYWQMALDFCQHPWLKNRSGWPTEHHHKKVLSRDEFIEVDNFQDWFAAILNFYCPQNDIAGIKISQHLKENVGLITKTFSKVFCLHIIRDPRDVFLSLRNTPFGTVSPYYVGKSWAEGVAEIQTLKNSSSFYHELKYEDLITQPENELKKICQWLGIKFEDKILKFYEQIEGNPPDNLRLLKEGFKKDNFNKWQNKLTAKELNLIYAGCGAKAYQAGYLSQDPKISISFLQHLWQYAFDKIIINWRKIVNLEFDRLLFYKLGLRLKTLRKS